MFKRKGHLPLVLIGLGLYSQALATDDPSEKAGFVTENAVVSSSILFTEQTTFNLCFGSTTNITTTISRPQAFFIDPQISPSEGLRVRLVNTSEAFAELNRKPFSDREYEDALLGSEKIVFAPGDRHRTRTFTVSTRQDVTTENSFSYEIYTDDAVLKKGSFSVNMDYRVLPDRVVVEGSNCGIDFPPPIDFP